MTAANWGKPLSCWYRFRAFRGTPRDWILRVRFKKFKVGVLENATTCSGGYLQVSVSLFRSPATLPPALPPSLLAVSGVSEKTIPNSSGYSRTNPYDSFPRLFPIPRFLLPSPPLPLGAILESSY